MLAAAARECVPKDKLVIIGTGAESARQCLARCKVAKDAGADAQASMRQLADSSLARLRNWDLSPSQVTALMKSGQPQRRCQGVAACGDKGDSGALASDSALGRDDAQRLLRRHDVVPQLQRRERVQDGGREEEVPLQLEPARFLSTFIGLLVAAVLGSAISLRRVTKVDPASAIGTAS